ncbi:MAG: hypothetical protein AUH25_02405 [Thaumarchaeota archaeon 13_1_40CM_38_12]|nr:MAG: hypothetical protein AUH25_02405 [Thaumarchaeota archaeon 13_1_40CM_38_12]
MMEVKILPVFILILLVPVISYGEQGMGSLEIYIKSTDGERADYHGMALKIYQDNAKVPFKTIESLSGNPYKISLPLGHTYKIEDLVSSMYASVGYVTLQNGDERLELTVPSPGSIRFIAVYNDGNTPINNATVMVKSNDGTYEYWTNSTTDYLGDTIRFWLQPTIVDDDYYVTTVSIGNDLSYSYYPISILPGVSRDIKITTPWPDVGPPLVVSVYKSLLQKVSKSDGGFAVQLYDNNGNKIDESKVNVMGEAYFSNIKVGSYTFRVIELNDDKSMTWGSSDVILDGKQTAIKIVKDQTDAKVSNVGQDALLVDIGIKADHIPSWVTKITNWATDGEITKQDFANVIKYLYTSGIIR